MNNHEYMNKLNTKHMDPSLKSLPEADFPSHLHAKIMKRVFFAGYGKYLYLSTGVLFLNLGVLSREIWRTASELQAPSLGIPLHVFVSVGITALATGYAFHMIWKLYKEYSVFAFAK